MSIKVALVLFLAVFTMQQDLRGGSIPGTPTRIPTEPPIISPPVGQQIDQRISNSRPTGQGQRSKGDYTIQKNPRIPPEISRNFNMAAAERLVAKTITTGEAPTVQPQSETPIPAPPSTSAQEQGDLINLEEKASTNSNGRNLHFGWHWYAIDLNWPVIDCPQYGFWVYVRGPALVWIKVGNQFYNWWPIYPWWWGQWRKINPPLAKCGCSKVTLYVWTYTHWFNWWVWRPSQNCMNNCVGPDRYWDYRRCRCTCRHRCCPWWSRAPTYPTSQGCNCQ